MVLVGFQLGAAPTVETTPISARIRMSEDSFFISVSSLKIFE